MPEEVLPQAMWSLPKITLQLQEAKMWPVKLRNIKHQDALSPLANYQLLNVCGYDWLYSFMLVLHEHCVHI